MIKSFNILSIFSLSLLLAACGGGSDSSSEISGEQGANNGQTTDNPPSITINSTELTVNELEQLVISISVSDDESVSSVSASADPNLLTVQSTSETEITLLAGEVSEDSEVNLSIIVADSAGNQTTESAKISILDVPTSAIAEMYWHQQNIETEFTEIAPLIASSGEEVITVIQDLERFGIKRFKLGTLSGENFSTFSEEADITLSDYFNTITSYFFIESDKNYELLANNQGEAVFSWADRFLIKRNSDGSWSAPKEIIAGITGNSGKYIENTALYLNDSGTTSIIYKAPYSMETRSTALMFKQLDKNLNEFADVIEVASDVESFDVAYNSTGEPTVVYTDSNDQSFIAKVESGVVTTSPLDVDIVSMLSDKYLLAENTGATGSGLYSIYKVEDNQLVELAIGGKTHIGEFTTATNGSVMSIIGRGFNMWADKLVWILDLDTGNTLYDEVEGWNINTLTSLMTESGETLLLHDTPSSSVNSKVIAVDGSVLSSEKVGDYDYSGLDTPARQLGLLSHNSRYLATASGGEKGFVSVLANQE